MTRAASAIGGARRRAKHGAYAAGRFTGGFALLRWLNRERVPILCYHSVVDRPLPPLVRAGKLHLPLDDLHRQLEFLARSYRVVPLEEVIERFAAGRAPAPRSVVLTFDDGYANNLRLAAPLLERFGFPATVFLTTAYVDSDSLFWWDELPLLLTAGLGRVVEAPVWNTIDLTSPAGVDSALAFGKRLLRAATIAERRQSLDSLAQALGAATLPFRELLRPARWEECRSAPSNVRFGGHTANHRVLDGIGLDDALADLLRCRADLRAQLGAEAAPQFCYPDGRWTPEVLGAVTAAGFEGAVTALPTPADERLATRSDDPLLLPRIGISSDMRLDTFAGNIAGVRSLMRI